MAVSAPEDPILDAAPLVPGLVLEIRYATADNPFHRAVYDTPVFALRRSVALLLARVARSLEPRGLRLVGFDGYRPLSLQKLLWELCPVVGYVAPPERGSNHNRGSAVDVGLADLEGRRLEMPSDYDEFTERSHHTYEGGSEQARRNRALLRAAMEAETFSANRMEWWHYDAPDPKRFPLEDVPLASLSRAP
jgi:zinc D-Ala-D-Ala dipeptidase